MTFPYEEEYQRMTTKYRLVNERIGLFRRIIRWLKGIK